MSDARYVIPAGEIAAMEGTPKVHFLNDTARRINKSLGDMTGLSGFGFHIIEVAPGDVSTEHHVHYHEDECVYILAGSGTAHIGDEPHTIGTGDFIGYAKGGLAHSIENTGTETLRCIVVGQRLPHDVGDYPRLGKRIYRNESLPWTVVDHDDLTHPGGATGKK